mgnify:CR=1 FL=1
MEEMSTEDVIKKGLGEVLNYLQQGVDFAQEQMPLVVQEIINWEITNSAFGGVLCLVSAFVLLYFSIKKLRIELAKGRSQDEETVCMASIGCVIGGFFTIGVIVFISQLIKALVAPRLVIIEKLSEMVSQ